MKDPAEGPQAAVMRRRAMWSSYLGSAVEYYDFLLYGIAATLVYLRHASADPIEA